MAHNSKNLITFEQACRLVAPMTYGLGNAVSLAEKMVMEWIYDERLKPEVTGSPIEHKALKGKDAFSGPWLQALSGKRAEIGKAWKGDQFGWESYKRTVIGWAQEGGLSFRRADIIACVRDGWVKDVDDILEDWRESAKKAAFVPGAKWNVAQMLAWICTRSHDEVGYISQPDIWAAPLQMSDQEVAEGMRSFYQCPRDRTRHIGRLMILSAEKTCICKATVTESLEKWQNCTCLPDFYEQLCDYSEVRLNVTLPNLLSQLEKGGFFLDWQEDSHSILVRHKDIIANWPADWSTGWSNERVKEWILNCELTNNRKAWDLFKKIRGSHCNSRSFSTLWNEVRQQKKGRPKKV